MKIDYSIIHAGEKGAGIIGYTEEVCINVNSGDPGGEDGEFAKFMEDVLAEWFDGASVFQVKTSG